VRQHSSQARALASRPTLRSTAQAAATLVTLLAASSAGAFEFDTGSPDFTLRWDNTVRYNLATRVQARDPNIGNSAVSDEGDYVFDKGDLVANRFDLLSELDGVYMKRYGFRASAAAWYDAAYSDHGASNPLLEKFASYPGNVYSDYTKNLYKGPDAELMDAFVFGTVDVGDVPVQIKAGRHTIYWGESLLLGGNLHSIAYAQNPLDLQKGYATPGVEAKELFRPLGQVSAQAQLTDSVSLAAQYMLEFQADRFPEGGTYLGPVDFAFNGPERQLLPGGLGFARNGGEAPTKNAGDFGLALRWSPEWADGSTFGAYYRNFTDKIPQALLTKVGLNSSQYNLIYAGGINLYGLSFAKNIAGVSVGSELSYRQNTPLTSQVLGVEPGVKPGSPAALIPGAGDTNGPRGDTMHGLVNAVGVIPQTPVFDSLSWVTELTWSRWLDVTQGQSVFNAVGYAPCMANGTTRLRDYDKWDGCATKDYVGLGLGVTPTWFAVLPGLDLQLPVTYSVGLSGNAATVFGGNQGSGNYTVGLGADLWQKYRFDLKFIDFLGRYREGQGPIGEQVATANGFNTYLKDRGFVSLTFKTTF
jgi:hypothetical protein